ncbi:MAG: hypothetical protein WDM77_05090 [Steroidobacteraceae bacterium]
MAFAEAERNIEIDVGQLKAVLEYQEHAQWRLGISVATREDMSQLMMELRVQAAPKSDASQPTC